MKALVHLAGNVAPVLAGLITAPLTARSLGPAARGELAIILLVGVFIGLVGAFGLGLLARQAVAADLTQAHGWSRRGRRMTIFAVAGSACLGVLVSLGLGLAFSEALASSALFMLAGMSASKSIDANILIVAGKTRQFGLANLAASGTVCAGIVGAYFSGTLTLWSAIALNAASLVVQMVCIVFPRRKLLRSVSHGLLEAEPFLSLAARAWRAWRSQMMEAAVTRVDSLLFMTQSAVQIVGLYAVVALIPQMAYQVFQTLIQLSYAASPTKKFRERTRLVTQVCLGISIPLAGLASLAALVLVPILFGDEFVPALKYLLPACAITVGLAGLAPTLHHFALSPVKDNWFPVSIAIIVGIGWATGSQLGTSAGVIAVGIGLILLSVAYGYLLSGPKLFKFSWRAIWRLYKNP